MKADAKAKLHQSSVEDLTKQIDKLQKELVMAKANIKLGKEPNSKAAKNIRIQIAVIKTIISEKKQTAGAE